MPGDLVQVKVVSTGETAWVTQEDAAAGVKEGAYEPAGKVLAETSTGERFAVDPADQAALGIEQAGAGAVAEETREAASEEKFGGVKGTALAIQAGVLSGATLGLSDALSAGGRSERAEEFRRLAQTRPGTKAAAQITTEVATGIASGGAGALGRAAAATPTGAVSRVAERIMAGGSGSRAVRGLGAGAIEGAAGGAANYFSNVAIQENPELSGEALVQSMGVGSLIGAGVGGAIGGASDAIARRKARKALGDLPEAMPDAGRVGAAVDQDATARAASDAVDDLLGESDRVPLTDLIPRADKTPEGVARRVQGIYSALGEADRAGRELRRQVDDTITPLLSVADDETATALRSELGTALRAHDDALREAKGWARGMDKRQRAVIRARREALKGEVAEETAAQRIQREQIKTTEAEKKAAERVERERLKTEAARAGAPAPRPKRGRKPKMPEGFDLGPGLTPKSPRHKGIPDHGAIDEDGVYILSASDLAARKPAQLAEGVDPARAASIRRGWSEGAKMEPLNVTMWADGRMEIANGRHRLMAAVEEGRDIPVRFSRGIEDAQPARLGPDAVRDWVSRYRQDRGEQVVSSFTGRSPGARKGVVDRIVTPQGPADPSAGPPIDITGARPGGIREALAAERAVDPADLLARRQSRADASKAIRELESLEPEEVPLIGHVLDGDTDDALEVFGRLDDATRQLQALVTRARSAGVQAAPAQAAGAVAGEAGEQAAQGVGGRLAQRAQDVAGGLEAAQAMGLPVPSLGSLPVVGPVLRAYLLARGAWRAMRGTSAALPSTASARAAQSMNRVREAAHAAAAKTLELGERALRSTVTPGLVARQAGRLVGRDRDAESRAVQAEVARLDALSPQEMRTVIAGVASGAPAEASLAAQDAAERALAYLRDNAPRVPAAGTPWALKTRLPAVELAKWEQRRAAVMSPDTAAADLAAGVRAPWAAEALRAVWPALWGAYREALDGYRDQLAHLPRYQRRAIGQSFRLALDPVQLASFPRPSPEQQQAPQPVQARPSSKPRLANIYATDSEQDELGGI